MIELLMTYMLRVMPGVGLGVVLLLLLPKKQTPYRIIVYILLFIMIRDAMTPMGLWTLGAEGVIWLRFYHEPILLIILGLVSVGTVITMNVVEKELKELLVWHRGEIGKSILFGSLGAVVVALPILIVYLTIPIEARGGKPELHMILPILVMALLGNFYEEVLFRGYFQGNLEKWVTPIRAAILSGVLFGFGHIFLATTVTDIGLPILLFATYEGIIAGFVRMKYGLIGATLTHGFAIFLLASGII